MLLEQVVVRTDDGDGARRRIARPMRGWKPETRSIGGLVLAHAPDAPLDAAWISAQFAANRMVGKVTGFDRITALVQLINLAFIDNGYANSGVLVEGRSAAGTLLLRFVSGRLAPSPDARNPLAVTFRGGRAKGLDADYVRHRLPSARRQPLNIRAIERDFRLLSSDPAIRTVSANLVPGARPGEAVLALEVDPQPRIDLATSFANNRSPSVGAQRLGVEGMMRSWHQAGDVLTLQYGLTKGLTDFSGSYTAPLFGPKWAINVRSGFNNAAVVDAPLVPLDIRSREFFVEGGLTRMLIARPLIPGPDGRQWQPAITMAIGAALVHRTVRSSLLGQPFSFGPNSFNGRTAYDALRLSFDFSRRSRQTVFVAQLTGTLGRHETGQRRPGAQPLNRMFSSVQVQLNYARRINPHLLELRVRLAGQFAGSLLNSAERFAVGGGDTVRGYRESLVLADHAAVGSIELAQPFDLGGRRGGGSTFRPGAFTASAFADAGYAHNRIAPQPLRQVLASLGGKLVWTPAEWLSGMATYGHALRHVAVAGRRDLQDRGVSFQITVHPLGLGRALGGLF